MEQSWVSQRTAPATWRDLEIKGGPSTAAWEDFRVHSWRKLCYYFNPITATCCEQVHNIAQGKGPSPCFQAMGAKVEGQKEAGVSLPQCRAERGGGTRHFYLCCADSAWLSLWEADEEEWPCGGTNRVHLYLSSSSESRIAESAAPPPPLPSLPPRGWEMTCLRLPDTLSVCCRSARPASAARHFPAQTLSARVDECFFKPPR